MIYTLIVLGIIFVVIEMIAIVKHIFEMSLGVFVLDKRNPKRQFVIHSSFHQLGFGFIAQYDYQIIITIHILNLHFHFIYSPKHIRSEAPAGLTSLSGEPTQSIIEWITNGIENGIAQYPNTNEFYFNAIKQGYSFDDCAKAINHFIEIGARATYDKKREEIIIKLI